MRPTCNDITVNEGATNVDFTMSASALFQNLPQGQSVGCKLELQFVFPGMQPCYQTQTNYLSNSGTVSTMRTCTIPGPLTYTVNTGFTATGTAGQWGTQTQTASCRITVNPKPPGPSPTPDGFDWALALKIGIPCLVGLSIIIYCCKRKKNTDQNEYSQFTN